MFCIWLILDTFPVIPAEPQAASDLQTPLTLKMIFIADLGYGSWPNLGAVAIILYLGWLSPKDLTSPIKSLEHIVVTYCRLKQFRSLVFLFVFYLFFYFVFFFFVFFLLFIISSDLMWYDRIIQYFIPTCIFLCERAQVHAPLVYIYIYIYMGNNICVYIYWSIF